MNNKEKIELLVKELNKDFEHQKQNYSPSQLWKRWIRRELSSISKISMNLSKEYNEDFTFEAEYKNPNSSHWKIKTWTTDIILTRGKEKFVITEVVQTTLLKNIGLKKLYYMVN
jgi:hypothetical protein